jgi:hypothetical protein
MTLFGLAFVAGGLAVLCWLLVTLAIYALPFFVGLSLGFAALHSGAGYLGGFVVGTIAAVTALAVGKFAFAAARSPFIRTAIGLVYTIPAAIAGYQATLGLARIGTPSEVWCAIFALAGALAVGATAWCRISGFTIPAPADGGARNPDPFRAASTTKDG